MLDYIASIKDTTAGIVLLGAIGSLLAAAVAKISVHVAKQTLPRFRRDWNAMHVLFSQVTSGKNRTDALFILLLACTLTITSSVLMMGSLIAFQIFKKFGASTEYHLVAIAALTFLFCYGVFKGLDAITLLTRGIARRYNTDFDGVLTERDANDASSFDQSN